MKKLFKTFLLFSIFIIIWLSKPVYDFYAHKGDVPLPFWGWQHIPEESPIVNELYNQRFLKASTLSLNKLIEHKKTIQSPAISVAVAIENELIWASAIGWHEKIPVNLNTRFRIGSTSKAITAILLARFVQAEKLDLDKSIANYLSPLPNPKWKNITLRHLASHTSGLPHYKNNTELHGLYRSISLKKNYLSMLDAIEVFDESDLLFEPGSDFFYSTLGTVLIGAIIESIEKKPFHKIINEQLFKPRLADNTIVAPLSSSKISNVATSYKSNRQHGAKHQVRVWRPVNLSHRLPGGGFASTPTDLVRLGSGMLDSNFIDQTTQKTFWTKQVIKNSDENHQNYALGWRVPSGYIENVGEVQNANHGGVSRGAQCWLMVIPKYKMTIAISINRKTENFWDFGKVSMDIASYFIQAQSK